MNNQAAFYAEALAAGGRNMLTAREPILEFQGEYRFLSNFWPCQVRLDGDWYPSVEHAYVAAKTRDPVLRQQIRATKTAGSVKRLGRMIDLRTDWDACKFEVMEDLVWQKFRLNDVLADSLLSTGQALLEEGNQWGDRVWGVSPAGSGTGQNRLGKILMEVRSRLAGLTLDEDLSDDAVWHKFVDDIIGVPQTRSTN